MAKESPEPDNTESRVEDTDTAQNTGRAWVASDATFHTFEKNNFENKSEIAIAIAVDDRSEFNTKYRNVIEEKSESYNFSPRRPVLKTHEIRDRASEWEYDGILTDFVEELLSINNILNIHTTLTTISNQMIKSYTETSGTYEQLSRDSLHGELTNYYHLIAVWDYLEEYRDEPWGTANILLDDFEGKDNKPWRRTGRISESLNIIPLGDSTYPMLSLADLTMDYLKENVGEWKEEEIKSTLIEATPDDSAYVNAKGIHTPDELEEIVPRTRRNIDRSQHYPHPIVFIDRGGMKREELRNFDVFHHIAEFVYENSGCLKFYSSSEDADIVESGDYIVCLGNSNTSDYSKFEDYNRSDNMVLTAQDVFDTLD